MAPTFCGTDQVDEELGSARPGEADLNTLGECGGDPKSESISPWISLALMCWTLRKLRRKHEIAQFRCVHRVIAPTVMNMY